MLWAFITRFTDLLAFIGAGTLLYITIRSTLKISQFLKG